MGDVSRETPLKKKVVNDVELLTIELLWGSIVSNCWCLKVSNLGAHQRFSKRTSEFVF